MVVVAEMYMLPHLSLSNVGYGGFLLSRRDMQCRKSALRTGSHRHSHVLMQLRPWPCSGVCRVFCHLRLIRCNLGLTVIPHTHTTGVMCTHDRYCPFVPRLRKNEREKGRLGTNASRFMAWQQHHRQEQVDLFVPAAMRQPTRER